MSETEGGMRRVGLGLIVGVIVGALVGVAWPVVADNASECATPAAGTPIGQSAVALKPVAGQPLFTFRGHGTARSEPFTVPTSGPYAVTTTISGNDDPNASADIVQADGTLVKRLWFGVNETNTAIVPLPTGQLVMLVNGSIPVSAQWRVAIAPS